MAVSLARVSAQLAEPGERVPAELIDLINRNVDPPTTLGADDVYIRAMYVVSDQVNSFGGRFPRDEHERLASLLVDSPVMVGHRRDKLPVGRTFHATSVMRGDVQWVKSYFYWLKSAEGSENLRDNIDGGIYKECSVAFTYCLPECSVCNKDIRECEHEPLREYRHDGTIVSCWYNYRQLERVLETSLVYRGALRDTSVSRDLKSGADGADDSPETADRHLATIVNLTDLDPSADYLVVPRYDGIPILIGVRDKTVVVTRRDGSVVDHPEVARLCGEVPPGVHTGHGLLVGYRGKERCSGRQVESFLAGAESPVRRLVLTLYPETAGTALSCSDKSVQRSVRVIPYRVVCRGDLHRKALEIMTRDGVEIWPAGRSPAGTRGYHYRPSAPEVYRLEYTITQDRRPGDGVITVRHGGDVTCFEIVRLDVERLMKGGRFVARRLAGPPSETGEASPCTVASGQVSGVDAEGDGMAVLTGGKTRERFIFRPVLLGGRRQYLFYRQGAQS